MKLRTLRKLVEGLKAKTPDVSLPAADRLLTEGGAVPAALATEVIALATAAGVTVPKELTDAEAAADHRRRIAEAFDPNNLTERVCAVQAAVRDQFNVAMPGSVYSYAEVVYTDHVIVSYGSDYYSIDYTIDDAGAVTFDGAPQEVERQISWAPTQEGAILGALADTDGERVREGATTTGRKWNVVVIEEGMSKNRNKYRRKALMEGVPLYNDRPIYMDHEEEPRRFGRSTKDKAGFLKDARGAVIVTNKEAADGTGVFAVMATAVVTKAWVRQEMLDAAEEGNLNHFGLSHDALCESLATISEEDGRAFYDVTKIESVDSVDFVTNAAAGGRVLRLVADVTEARSLEGDGRMLKKMIEAIRKSGNAAAIARLDAIGAEPNEDQVLAIFTDVTKAAPVQKTEAEIKAERDAADAAAKATKEAKAEQKTEGAVITVAAWLESQRHGRQYFMEGVVNGTSLPEPVKAELREDFLAQMSDAKTADELPTMKTIEDRVRKSVATFAKLVEAKVVSPTAVSGDTRVQITKDRREKMVEAFDAFFNREKPAQSFKNLYVDFTGDRTMSGKLSESHRLSESLTTSSFDQILGDSITRQMLREYALPQFQAWRGTIADVVPVTDFRTQRRMRFGGYANLNTVSEGAPYPSMTSPTDEEATYSPAKRGGTEQITIEMIANDDVGALRRIPTRLARAAGQTLYEFVFDFLRTNPNIYDGTALIASGHANNSVAALASSVISTLRLKMKAQTDMSNSKRLGISPKYLIVPNDLEELAYQITSNDKATPDSALSSTAAASAKNFIARVGIQPLVVDYWTDVNDWFLTASVADLPMIEIGFFGGENPELYVQDQPNVGSMFSNDALTYKIKHTYGGGVMDYRGFTGSIVP